jgi:SPW repeat
MGKGYYWWIEAGLGSLLVISPMVGHFTQAPGALWSNAVVGLALEVWAVIGSYYLGSPAAPGASVPGR